MSLFAFASVAQAAGQMLGAFGTAKAGAEQAAALHFEAQQLRQNALQAQAASQRIAFSEQRQGEYAASAALAQAAASGGGASDPTVINLIARNAAESAYRTQVALYEGDDKARSLRLSADAKDYEAKSVRRGSRISAVAQGAGSVASLLSASAKEASLLQRFGGGGPTTMGGPG